ncbi:MAG: Dabb family protein [Alphaproteobacteria bacterium]|nr:Dabb family protein [Alphaproteobacteria bacterium]
MAVKHMVLVELKDGVTDEQIQAAVDDLRALKGQIPGLLEVDAGRNFTDRAGNYNFAAVMTLESKEALAGYGPHPAHQAAAGKLGAFANGLLVVDFEV